MDDQIDLYTDQLTTPLPQIKGGKLKALLVLSPDRIAQLPDVPSLSDIGTQPFDGGTTAACSAAAEPPARSPEPWTAPGAPPLKTEAAPANLANLGPLGRPPTPAGAPAYTK